MPTKSASARRGSGSARAPAWTSNSAIQPTVGSRPMTVTEPLPYAASAATTRSPVVTSARPSDQLAAHGRDVRQRHLGPPPGGCERAAATSTVVVGSVGEERIGEAGQDTRAGGPADDDQAAAQGQPATEGRELVGGQLVRVDVLPDQAVDRRPGLEAIRAGPRRSSGTRTGLALFWTAGQLDAGRDPGRLRGDDADGELAGVVDRERDLLAGDASGRRRRGRPRSAAERRRLRVEHVALVRGARQVDRHGEARAALDCRPGAGARRRPACPRSEPNLDREPRPEPGVALEERAGFELRAVRGHRPAERPARRGRAAATKIAPTRPRARGIRDTATPVAEEACGRASTRRIPRKSCVAARSSAERFNGSPRQQGGRYRTIPRSGPRSGSFPECRERAEGAMLAVAASVPRETCPRSVRSAPSVTRPTRSPMSAAVVAPPYDVIGPEEHARLLARHPANVVRLDLPAIEPGEEPDERYRRAARTLAAVALRRDAPQGSARGDLRLRADVPRSRHRRRADPARVLRPAPARAARARIGRPPPRADARGPARGPVPAAAGDRREHEPGRRALRRPVRDELRGPGDAGRRRACRRRTRRRRRPPPPLDRRGGRAARGPRGRRLSRQPAPARSRSRTATIATRPRCATATSGGCRARARRIRRSTTCSTLLLEATAEPLTILPTHRVVRGLGADGVPALRDGLEELFDSRPASRDELLETFEGSISGGGAGGSGSGRATAARS